jgi:hypothetical protein
VSNPPLRTAECSQFAAKKFQPGILDVVSQKISFNASMTRGTWSHKAVIRVYDEAGNLTEKPEQQG